MNLDSPVYHRYPTDWESMKHALLESVDISCSLRHKLGEIVMFNHANNTTCDAPKRSNTVGKEGGAFRLLLDMNN